MCARSQTPLAAGPDSQDWLPELECDAMQFPQMLRVRQKFNNPRVTEIGRAHV